MVLIEKSVKVNVKIKPIKKLKVKTLNILIPSTIILLTILSEFLRE